MEKPIKVWYFFFENLDIYKIHNLKTSLFDCNAYGKIRNSKHYVSTKTKVNLTKKNLSEPMFLELWNLIRNLQQPEEWLNFSKGT